ncbi:LpqN/LpqT family lipoprotein [Mycolicibacterium frederiksbergense]|uniref:LpqN/LpqT family lipoprotein n=1 Tax=Mycolicibacterium frederiksbergense TaxID=117567 RepID=UPI00265C5B4C|nr:LpqN/LpqT family lipoprotein [Mycolicibacterium frederiksbergense]MBX9920275.1 LpqN/LpqT family lipoprotein [Mycolicibacterium frederiksbergense]MDO0975117.1 LpqN/LpqT family lipoprotein [Mycolicibacterium frederiksbergense]
MRAALAVVVAAATLLTGCGAATPDYQSLLATTPTRPTPTTSEETVPLSAYLESVGVKGEPVAPEKLTDLAVTVPRPKGWQDYTNTNLAPGTRVIADGETYPTAMLMVFTLDGDFDTAEALKHADVDAEISENFKKLNGSREDFKGFPSSMIEGTYDVGGQRMQAYNRIVFATGRMPDKPAPGQLEPKAQKYLVQLTITSFADDAEAKGAAIEQIISGFDVSAK